MKKRYYETINIYDTSAIIKYVWHCTEQIAAEILTKSSDFVIPLERKPRNTEIREG